MESKLKATDLMIGDWVIDYKDRFVRVHGIEPTWNEIWVNYANGSGIYKSNVDFTKPIPLTQELLEKCGCTIIKGELNFKGITILHNKNIGDFGFVIDYTPFTFKYLHEFQQFARLLTKQELIINL